MGFLSVTMVPFATAIRCMLVIAVPEPAAIPEFFACVLGIGYLAWRRSRRKP